MGGWSRWGFLLIALMAMLAYDAAAICTYNSGGPFQVEQIDNPPPDPSCSGDSCVGQITSCAQCGPRTLCSQNPLGSACCNNGDSCSLTYACTPCGGNGQPVCTSGAACNAGFEADGGICVACGGHAQRACGNSPPSPGGTCSVGPGYGDACGWCWNSGGSCGDPGEPACSYSFNGVSCSNQCNTAQHAGICNDNGACVADGAVCSNNRICQSGNCVCNGCTDDDGACIAHWQLDPTPANAGQACRKCVDRGGYSQWEGEDSNDACSGGWPGVSGWQGVCCNGTCVNNLEDESNCGWCGVGCNLQSGQICDTPGAPPGRAVCQYCQGDGCWSMPALSSGTCRTDTDFPLQVCPDGRCWGNCNQAYGGNWEAPYPDDAIPEMYWYTPRATMPNPPHAPVNGQPVMHTYGNPTYATGCFAGYYFSWDGLCRSAPTCSGDGGCYDDGYCRGSGEVCDNGMTCSGGACNGCPAGTTMCGGSCLPNPSCGACNSPTCVDRIWPFSDYMACSPDNTLTCNDGNVCTSGDYCSGGSCVGSTLPLATCGVGACTRTGTTCQVSSCTPGTAGTEICNGVDDDCNGAVDNGVTPTSQSCTVGIGACMRTGTQTRTCNGASGWGAWGACSATAGAPVAETCNGLDDNCDGYIDNAPGVNAANTLTSTAGCNQVGACGGAYQTCTAGSWGVCSKLPGTESIAAGTCSDGIDNDCDSETDYDGFTNGIVSPAVKGDSACPVSVTSAIAQTPMCVGVQGSLQGNCTYNVVSRSGTATLGANSCTFLNWSGTTALFNCSTAGLPAGSATLTCAVNTTRSYLSGPTRTATATLNTASNACGTNGACGATGICQSCDVDGDTYNNLTMVGCSARTDCNDFAANIHPGAALVCGNGVSEDCSGCDPFCSMTWNGRLLDVYGQGIRGTVRFDNQPTHHATAGDGSFSVPAIGTGLHNLSGNASGFDSVTVVGVNFACNNPTNQNIILPEAQCKSDCTFGGFCRYDVCNGANSCGLTGYNSTEQQIITTMCGQTDKGTLIELNSTHTFECCTGRAIRTTNLQTPLTIQGCSENLITLSRTVNYKGRILTMEIVTYEQCD